MDAVQLLKYHMSYLRSILLFVTASRVICMLLINQGWQYLTCVNVNETCERGLSGRGATKVALVSMEVPYSDRRGAKLK